MATEGAQRERWRAELVRTRCALDIAYAHYRRAVSMAMTTEETRRPATLAEARRVLEAAAILRARVETLEAEHGARPLAPGRPDESSRTRRV